MDYRDLFLSFEKRRQHNLAIKEKIAGRALEMIKPGDEIFLGAGTTVACLGEMLAESGRHFMLKIWTNNFFLVDLWLKKHEIFFSENFVAITAGEISKKNISIVNIQLPFSRVPKLFIGTPGLSTRGLESDDIHTVQQIEQLVRRTGEVIIMADASKLGRECTYLARTMRMIRIDIGKNRPYTVITDSGDGPLAAAARQRFQAAGLRIITT